MANIHWSNAVDGNFDNAADWSTGTVPGRSDNAFLDADGGSPYTVTASANETIGTLSISQSDSLSITGGAFTIGDGATLAQGSTIAVTGGGVLTLRGASSGFSAVSQASIISVGDGSSVFLRSAKVVSCLLASEGSGKFIVEGQSVITRSTGTIAVRPGAVLSGNFTLSGATSLAKAGGAEIALLHKATNEGAVTLHAGDAIIVQVDPRFKFNDLTNTRTGVISGAGQIGKGKVATAKMLLGNDGVIDARGRGRLTLNTGKHGILNNGTIEATDRGLGKISSPLRNFGVLKASGGSLVVDGVVTGNGSAVIDNGTLAFGSIFRQDVAFTGDSGVLKLGQSGGYTGDISGFSKTGGTSLDLLDIGFTGAGEASFSGNHNSGVLTVTDGSRTAHITLTGDYTGVTFVASSDGHGGVSITDSQTAARATAASARHQFISVIAGFGDPGGPVTVWHDTGSDPSRPVLSGPRSLH